MEAHALWKSNGNRLLGPEDFVGREWKEVFNKFRGWTMATPYDHERVVSIAEAMDAALSSRPTSCCCSLASIIPTSGCDVMRARTLNGAQSAAGREKHLCPLQFDVVDRLISRFSNPGDLVMDPFGGLGTVALQAVKAGRCGLTVELNPQYHDDAVRYLRAHDEKVNTPTLFDGDCRHITRDNGIELFCADHRSGICRADRDWRERR
jgi:DNA modification methylase